VLCLQHRLFGNLCRIITPENPHMHGTKYLRSSVEIECSQIMCDNSDRPKKFLNAHTIAKMWCAATEHATSVYNRPAHQVTCTSSDTLLLACITTLVYRL
jgi:hypothetical protein